MRFLRSTVSALLAIAGLVVSAVPATAQGFGIGARVAWVHPDTDVDVDAIRYFGGQIRLIGRRAGVEVAMDRHSESFEALNQKVSETPLQASLLLRMSGGKVAPYLLGGPGWYRRKVEALNGPTDLNVSTTGSGGTRVSVSRCYRANISESTATTATRSSTLGRRAITGADYRRSSARPSRLDVDIGRDCLFLGPERAQATRLPISRLGAKGFVESIGERWRALANVRIHLLRDGDDVGDVAAEHLHLVAQFRQRVRLTVTVTFEVLLGGRQRAQHVLALCAKVPQPGGSFVGHNSGDFTITGAQSTATVDPAVSPTAR